MIRQELTGLLSLAVVVLAVSPAQAAGRFVRECEGKTNNSGITYTDFHLIITSDTAINGVYGVIHDGAQFHRNPTITGEGTNTVQINWDGLSIDDGESIGVGVHFTLEEWNTYRITKQWTDTAARDAFDTSALGLSVLDCGEYYLTNEDSDQTVNYSNLEYTVQSTPMAPANSNGTDTQAQEAYDLAEGLSSAPGWTSPANSNGSVAPQDDTFVINLDIVEGEYLLSYLTYEFEDGTDGGLTYTIQEHEHQEVDETCGDVVPTVSEWGLIVMTLVLLTAGTVVFGRRRRHAAV